MGPEKAVGGSSNSARQRENGRRKSKSATSVRLRGRPSTTRPDPITVQQAIAVRGILAEQPVYASAHSARISVPASSTQRSRIISKRSTWRSRRFPVGSSIVAAQRIYGSDRQTASSITRIINTSERRTRTRSSSCSGRGNRATSTSKAKPNTQPADVFSLEGSNHVTSQQ